MSSPSGFLAWKLARKQLLLGAFRVLLPETPLRFLADVFSSLCGVEVRKLLFGCGPFGSYWVA